jgi:4-amino-4-deoxy-L-arabinose transferase-like glycosyltransferase
LSAPAIRVRADPDGARALPSPGRRAVLRRVPRAAWVCALVAILNAVCWSLVTPAFQAPDEPDHVAYVKQLAETGELPASSSEQLSTEELAVLVGVRHFYVLEQPQNHTISSPEEVGELNRYLALAAAQPHSGSPTAGVAASQPPLYYALESIPYALARGASLLVRVQLMRLLSALFAGLTALFAFLFAREALPAARWSWTVAGLTVALVPLFGFMSGSVNPDALLYAVSAASFYLLARTFRRGLDTRAALALGAVTAVGFLTKLNFVGLAPGLVLGVALLSARAYRAHGRPALRLPAICLGIGFAPPAVYALVNAVSNHPLFGLVSKAARTVHGSVFAELNYIWQMYLPRLPGTANDFPGVFTTKQLWFHGYVGLYGWFDTTFPGWVYSAALVPALALALLCARELVRGRAALRARAGELAVYATIALGLMVLIGADGYHSFPYFTGTYAQVRYLLPLLPLFGVALALAARGAGRRWGPLVGTLIVMLFLAHDLFSQMLTIGRYYG